MKMAPKSEGKEDMSGFLPIVHSMKSMKEIRVRMICFR